MDNTISIIIPVYNAEKYLFKCLESVIGQDYPNKEIIVVNDGSTDQSLSIIMSFVNRNRNIYCINKPNEGVELARKSGLDMATGQFVTFLDSDDIMCDGALSKMYNMLIQENVDLVCARINRICLGGIVLKKKISQEEYPFLDRKITKPELWDDLYCSFFGISRLPLSMYAKLYKKELLSHWVPKGLRFGEDLAANMDCFPYVESLYFLSDPLVNYRVGGITSGFMPFFWDNCKKLYFIKKQALLDNHYLKALPYIVWELKNELKTHIKQLIIFGIHNDSRWLTSEFKNPIFDDFDSLLESGYQPKSALDEAIYRRDGDSVWNMMCHLSFPDKCKKYLSRFML